MILALNLMDLNATFKFTFIDPSQ